MLNYVWLALVLIGIGAAVTTDISDNTINKYQNGTHIPVTIIYNGKVDLSKGKSCEALVKVKAHDYGRIYAQKVPYDIIQKARLTVKNPGKEILFYSNVDDKSPDLWKKMAKINGKEDDLTGSIADIRVLDSVTAEASLVLEEVRFAKMKDVTGSALDYAGNAVNIALGLIGIMALWLGIMKVAEEAGLIKIISKALRPLTKLLFPRIPSDHPAMGAMIMNISANMLGLSNAATPFGLKAMEELNKLNETKGTASNEMCTFLAVNTAGLTLIPATAIAIRAASGSSNPAIIIGTSVFGATCATIAGITAAKVLERFPIKKGDFFKWLMSNLKVFIGLIAIASFVAIFTVTGLATRIFAHVDGDIFKNIVQIIAVFAIPTLIFSFLAYGLIKRINVYEKFIEGAKEGFNVAIRIIPYLVAMLVAIGIFRAGGAMDFLITMLRPLTDLIGMPAEALPMALMRPLSGSGSLGIMAETIKVNGPDSLIGIMTSTFFGSSETTFYVLAVYFGSVGISKTRHALPVGLIADIAGTLGAVFICRMLFG
jgi:spore maturation protein SpmA